MTTAKENDDIAEEFFKKRRARDAARVSPLVAGQMRRPATAEAAQAELGHVHVVRCTLALRLIEEARQFPRGTNDDLIESAFSGFNVLARSAGVPRRRVPLSSGYVTG